MERQNFKCIWVVCVSMTVLFLKCNSQNSGQYLCNVGNCQKCSQDNDCFQCNHQFILQLNVSSGKNICRFNDCRLANCKYCIFNSTQCWECNPGFIRRNYKCEPNICHNHPFCLSCDYYNICTQCKVGYVLYNSNIGNCLVCNIQNCKYCYPQNDCLFCDNGYYFQQGTRNCIRHACNITNCVQCWGDNKCGECPPGYNVVNNTCILCKIINCKNCTSSNTCHYCLAGFGLVNNTCQALSCNIANCMYCQYQNNVCTKCSVEYQLKNNSCIAYVCNISNCISCAAVNQCYECNPGFILYPYYKCVLCNVSNCKGCNTSNICEYCLYGYSLANNICTPFSCAISNCVLCTSNNVCGGCIDGFSPKNNVCTAYTCSISNCKFCSSNNKCKECNLGFALFYDVCVVCNVANCKTCFSNNICGECKPGFNMYTAGCLTCNIANCVSCSANNVCDQCSSRYGLDNNVCVLLIVCDVSDCLSCSADNICELCHINFTMSAGNMSCDCSTAKGFTLTSGICQCPIKTTYNTDECTACDLTNCLNCLQDNKCNQCQPTYYLKLFVNSSTMCYLCNIQYCEACSDHSVCSKCDASYKISTNASKCVTCTVPDCKSCIENGFCGQCNPGLALDSGACRAFFCTLPHCLSCVSGDNVCSSCHHNFTVGAGNTSCDCATAKGFALVSGLCNCPIKTTYNTDKCTTCNNSNCLRCLQTNICVECEPTYYLKTFADSSMICYLCNIQYCEACSAHSICSQCDVNHKINANASKCVICTVPNCRLCNQNDVCEHCNNGYNLLGSGSTTSCISCTLSFCQKCSANQFCSQCSAGYSLVSGACKPCDYPCKTCTQTLTCQTCSSPFGIQPNVDEDCLFCNVPFCSICRSSNSANCITCQNGYVLNNTLGKCVFGCSAHCRICSGTTCSACQNGYRLSNNLCVKCNNAPYCKQCSSNTAICTQCSSAFYRFGSECLPCADNCEACAGPIECTTYRKNSGQFQLTTNGMIQPAICDPGCLKCSLAIPSICLVCENGYSLSTDSVCVACDPKCKTCDITPTNCSSCYDNAFFSAESYPATCLQCDAASNCQVCLKTNRTNCVTCPNNYVKQLGVCFLTKCPLNCLKCSSLTQCTACKEGYALSPQKTCLPCVSSCRRCSGISNAICLDCGRKFYLSQASTCIPCSNNCQSCNQLTCTQCQSGYFVNSTFKCSVVCSYPCATCDSVNSTLCKSCLAGFTYDTSTNKCKQVLSCTDGCVTCPFSYFINGNECTPCTVDNCARCSTASLCILCKDGYFLANSTACTKCPNGISKCSSQSFALGCSPGFTSFTTNNNFGSLTCIECSSPCKTCTGDPEQCDTCIEGYFMEGWKCTANFNFNFKITFALSSGDFYSQYSGFLTSLAQNFGGDMNAITIKSIKQEPRSQSSPQKITVEGTTSVKTPSNSTASTTQYKNLQSSLRSGRLIKGMRVVYSEVQVNGGILIQEVKEQKEKQYEEKQEEQVNNSSTFIFYGVTGSVGFVASILIAQLLYLKCKKREPSTTMQISQLQQVNEDPTSEIVIGHYNK